MISGLSCYRLSTILLVYLCTLVRAHPIQSNDGFIDYSATYTSTEFSESTLAASGVSGGAAAALCVGALVGAGLLPVVIVAGVGACLEWGRPGTTEGIQTDEKAQEKDVEHGMVYPKAELCVKEKVIYELDGQDAVLEIDGVSKAESGELDTS